MKKSKREKRSKKIKKWLLKHATDSMGNIIIEDIDFGNRDVRILRIRTRKNLYSEHHVVEGCVYQREHIVHSDLFQGGHMILGYLNQEGHKVTGSLSQGYQAVGGVLYQDDRLKEQ